MKCVDPVSEICKQITAEGPNESRVASREQSPQGSKKQEPIKSTDVCELLNDIRNDQVLGSQGDSVEKFQHMDLTESLKSIYGLLGTFTHRYIPKDQKEECGFQPSFEKDHRTNSQLSATNSEEINITCDLENDIQEVDEADLPPGFEPDNVRMQNDSVDQETQQCKEKAFDNGPSRVLIRPKFHENLNQWKCISLLFDHLRRTLHKSYRVGETLDHEDRSFVLKVLQYHPQSTAKIGSGVQEIKIGCNPAYPRTRCFVVVRKDGSTDDFSFHKCLKNLAAKFSPSLAFEYEQRFCPQ